MHITEGDQAIHKLPTAFETYQSYLVDVVFRLSRLHLVSVSKP